MKENIHTLENQKQGDKFEMLHPGRNTAKGHNAGETIKVIVMMWSRIASRQPDCLVT